MGTILEKLNKLANTKEKLKKGMENKGIKIETENFSDLVDIAVAAVATVSNSGNSGYTCYLKQKSLKLQQGYVCNRQQIGRVNVQESYTCRLEE